MTETDKAFAKILEKLSSIVDTHAAEAVALGGKVLQMEVAGRMIWPLILTVVGAAIVYAGRRLFQEKTRRYLAYRDDRSLPYFDEENWTVSASLTTGAGVLIASSGFIAICVNCTSPLHWAILFDDRLAVAAKILGLI